MPKKKSASSKNSRPEVKIAEKPTTILALKRPSPPPIIEKSVEKEVIPHTVTTKAAVAEDAASPLPLSEKPSIEVAENTLENTDVAPPVESVTESIDSGTDPLIGTKIEVTAPWGAKVMVEVSSTYLAPGGDKWVVFGALAEIPAGWLWRGGVKRIGATVA